MSYKICIITKNGDLYFPYSTLKNIPYVQNKNIEHQKAHKYHMTGLQLAVDINIASMIIEQANTMFDEASTMSLYTKYTPINGGMRYRNDLVVDELCKFGLHSAAEYIHGLNSWQLINFSSQNYIHQLYADAVKKICIQVKKYNNIEKFLDILNDPDLEDMLLPYLKINHQE
jgi:hypothetical protein